MVSYLQNTNQLEVYNGSAWASIAPTSTQGLTLINSQSFSAVASQRVNPFSATYQNYRIILTATQSTSTPMKFRLASGASVISTSTYRRGGWAFTTNSTSGHYFASSSETSVIITQNSGFVTIDIANPFEAAATSIIFDGNFDDGTNTSRVAGMGRNTNATSYDGFELSPDSGTFTGNVRVYGYNI
jgi:hypothetical protein